MIENCPCGKPVTDAFVCSACADDLGAVLAEVPSLAINLDEALARQTAFGDRSPGRAATTAIPFDGRASDLKRDLHGVLVGWTRLCFEERAGIAPTWPADELGPLAIFVLGQVEWLRHHEAGYEAVNEITRGVERVRELIDRPLDRWYAGLCDACGADLYPRLGQRLATCACGATYDVPERRAWLLDRAQDVLCGAADMSRALTSLDQPVTAERIRKWRERGQILEHARDRRGQALYRVGDVRELLDRATRRGPA